MGNARWSPDDWSTHQSRTAHKTQQQIFTQSSVHPELDPRNIKVRESVDSDQNPNSTPLTLACDDTGSMGVLAEIIIKHGLGVIMEEIDKRKPVTDPHLMCMSVGDCHTDDAALQVTQFEAGTVLIDQLKNFWIEGKGGGNGGESYHLAWYFMAFKTKCDAQVKRHRKGYLFTIGDEAPHDVLHRQHVKRFIGDDVEADLTNADLLQILAPNWEVFHLIVKPAYPEAVTKWKALLGERAIEVSDHEKLAEVIVSTIQVIEGHDPAAVAASWSGDTSLVVANATRGLTRRGEHAGVSRL